MKYGSGVDRIDLQAATNYGIIVAHFPDHCVREVANHAITLMLACARRLLFLHRTLQDEGWGAAREKATCLHTVFGETLGLIAFGNIARAVAERAKALGMQVVACDPFVDAAVFAEAGVESVTFEDLPARADYVSCHLPLSAQTRGMIGASFFERMKPTAHFINTSRGAVVIEPDLVEALRGGQIAGAALDVFASEPQPLDREHPFFSMGNVILTPHIAGWADASRPEFYRRVALSALAIARGHLPEFVANPDVLAGPLRAEIDGEEIRETRDAT